MFPDGTIYSLTSHWVPEIPFRKQQHFSAQWGARSETDFGVQCDITREAEYVGSQTDDIRIATRIVRKIVIYNSSIISCKTKQ
jgi:hypothetical protein